MRIIGGKDYYDSAMAYGQDRDLVFVRNKNETIPVEKTPLVWTFPNVYVTEPYKIQSGRVLYKESDSFRYVTVYFAGKQYRGIRFIPDSFDFTSKAQTFWTLNKLESKIKDTDYRLVERQRRTWISFEDGPKTFEEFFKDQGSPVSESVLNWLVEHRVAIALCCDDAYRDHRDPAFFRINTTELANYHFQQVLDPYTAFQELSMFVGGVLPRDGNPMVEVSDKSLIAKHGFDKWSFRKQKEATK